MPSSYNTNIEANVSGITNRRIFLKNTLSPVDLNGFICNMDVTADLPNWSNTLKIRMWVVNTAAGSNTLSVSGCATAGPCAAVADFTVAVAGGKTYATQYLLQEEIIEITKSTGAPGHASVKLNGGAVNIYLNFRLQMFIMDHQNCS